MSDATLPRSELVKLVARAHGDASYAESTQAGKELAAQSKLPRVIAENLGAGFGQWDFFPEAAEIVELALSYVPPTNEEDVWALARRWATDDANARPTPLALVGREILQHELKRIDVPKLRALVDEVNAERAHALRKELGLDAPAAPAPARPKKQRAARPARAPVEKREIPTRMPRPEFKKPVKAEPPPPPKRYSHPKFGEGVLEAQTGVGPEAKLTIKFAAGSKTLQAQYVTELAT